MAESFAKMIGVLREANSWRSLGETPAHIQYFVLNVKGGGLLESISEDVYEKENPEWAKAIRDDYAKIVKDKEDAEKLREAVEITDSEAVKFIAGLSEKQRAKLMALLADEPEVTPAPDVVAVAAPAV